MAVVALSVFALPTSTGHAGAATSAGTNWCGSFPQGTTTWNALGSPYTTCGIVLQTGERLVVDATLGPVRIVVPGGVNGIEIDGGSLSTVSTSAASDVIFTQPPNDGSPIEVTNNVATAGDPTINSVVSLRYADFGDNSFFDMTGASISLQNVTAGGLTLNGPDVSVTDSTVSGPVVIDSRIPIADELQYQIDATASPTATATVADTTITPDYRQLGSALSITSANLAAYDDTIDHQSGDAPAVALSGQMAIGETDGVSGLSGSDDSEPIALLNGTSVTGFEWPAAPRPDQNVSTPLGYEAESLYVSGAGDVSVDANAVVAATLLDVEDGSLVATAGATTFEGMSSNPPANPYLNEGIAPDQDGSSTVVAETLDLDGVNAYSGLGAESPTGTSTIDDSALHQELGFHGPLTMDDSIVDGGISGDYPTGDSSVTDSTVTGSRYSWAFEGFDNSRLSCDVVTGNSSGLYLTETDSVESSSLYGNQPGPGQSAPNDSPITGDVVAQSGGAQPIDATHDWWGQAGGPASYQVFGPVDTSSSLSAPASCTENAPSMPSPATDLAIEPSTNPVLSWVNPTTLGSSGVTVRMLPGDTPPADPTQGIQVYSGTGDSVTLGGLALGTYSFTIFSSTPNLSIPGAASLTTTIRDPKPPGGLKVTMYDGKVRVSWQPSPDAGTVSVIRLAKLDAAWDQGKVVCRGVGSATTISDLGHRGDRLIYAYAIDSVGASGAEEEQIDRPQLVASVSGRQTARLGIADTVVVHIHGHQRGENLFAPIRLYEKRLGTATFHFVASAASSNGRKISFSVTPRVSERYEARFASGDGNLSTWSNVTTIRVERR